MITLSAVILGQEKRPHQRNCKGVRDWSEHQKPDPYHIVREYEGRCSFIFGYVFTLIWEWSRFYWLDDLSWLEIKATIGLNREFYRSTEPSRHLAPNSQPYRKLCDISFLAHDARRSFAKDPLGAVRKPMTKRSEACSRKFGKLTKCRRGLLSDFLNQQRIIRKYVRDIVESYKIPSEWHLCEWKFWQFYIWIRNLVALLNITVKAKRSIQWLLVMLLLWFKSLLNQGLDRFQLEEGIEGALGPNFRKLV